jgi:Flp pilus assembly protein TadD
MPSVCLFVLILSSVLPAFAANVSGEVVCESCNNFSGLYVELSGPSRKPQAPLRSAVSMDGRFLIVNVANGDYTLVVSNGAGSILTRDSLYVSDIARPVTVRVESSYKISTATNETGPVSVKRLSHKIPKAAKKAFDEAARKAEKGQTLEAVALLQKAIQLDPEYVEALNNLGARYILIGDHERAIPHLMKAIEIDPHSVQPYSNLGIALMATGDAEGAERAARQALEADPAEVRARYILGMSLYAQRKVNTETLQTLRIAQERFPRAQLALAMVEAASGETAQARETLKSYLKSNQTYMRAQAEHMLENLEAQGMVASK